MTLLILLLNYYVLQLIQSNSRISLHVIHVLQAFIALVGVMSHLFPVELDTSL